MLREVALGSDTPCRLPLWLTAPAVVPAPQPGAGGRGARVKPGGALGPQADAQRMHALWLTFRGSALEADFAAWHSASNCWARAWQPRTCLPPWRGRACK